MFLNCACTLGMPVSLQPQTAEAAGANCAGAADPRLQKPARAPEQAHARGCSRGQATLGATRCAQGSAQLHPGASGVEGPWGWGGGEGDPSAVRRKRGGSHRNSSVRAEVAATAPPHAPPRRGPPRAQRGQGRGSGARGQGGVKARVRALRSLFATRAGELLRAASARSRGLARSVGRLYP